MCRPYIGIYTEMFCGRSFVISKGLKYIFYKESKTWHILTNMLEDVFYSKHAIFKSIE